jgi:hypothetical protein
MVRSGISTDEVLKKAYRLAYFLHQDKGVAIRIVTAATLKLNVATAVQSKRLYYIPVGRFSRGESRRTDGIRNKAMFSDLHLLQRLVYGESEPFERQKEHAALVGPQGTRAGESAATEDDLLVYFIKHLVRITTKRNAFYVTLGISRLLHSYSTLETMEIYNAVIGEPERVKDDYYYRSRKGVLMQEMSQRFGQLIRACRRRRGEERFETQQVSSAHQSIVRECLRLFTPWDTYCPVPPDFDPLTAVIARLTSNSSADENRVEVNRIHAVLHPNCFVKLIAGLGYPPPEQRLEVPRFFSNQADDQSPPRQRCAPADLSAEELAEINHTLTEQAGRRRRSSPVAVLRIMVDGIERATLNPAEQSSISFSAEEGAEIIEVKTTDPGGELLLATHVLTGYREGAHDRAVLSSIVLESGQELSLAIMRTKADVNGAGKLLVKFGYHETNPRRAASLFWHRLGRHLSPAQGRADSRGFMGAAISPRLIFVSGAVLICLASYLGYVILRPHLAGRPTETSSVHTAPLDQDRPSPSGVAGGETNPPSEVASPQAEVAEAGTNDRSHTAAMKETVPTPPARRRARPENDESTATRIPEAISTSPGEDGPRVSDEGAAPHVTRSGSVVTGVGLGEVQKVYIETRGDGALDQLRSGLFQGLNASGLVAATTGTDEANASLKIMVSQPRGADRGGAPQVEVLARLVNARGEILWPKAGRGVRGRYMGGATKVLQEMLKDLLNEIRVARAGSTRR